MQITGHVENEEEDDCERRGGDRTQKERRFEKQFAAGKDEEIARVPFGISTRVDGVRIGPGRRRAMMPTMMRMIMLGPP